MNTLPKYREKGFQCPYCKVVAQQIWIEQSYEAATAYRVINDLFFEYRQTLPTTHQAIISNFLTSVKNQFCTDYTTFFPPHLSFSTCTHCYEPAIWINRQLVFPKSIAIDPPNHDLNQEIIDIYNEATSIVQESPRGAAALLRLALQKLLQQLGKSGNNINQDIKTLVDEGMSQKLQQALDLVRVVGNNAVHPGKIDLNDNKEIALKLFQILNFIAHEMISKPKEIEDLYNSIIPEETKQSIKERNS